MTTDQQTPTHCKDPCRAPGEERTVVNICSSNNTLLIDSAPLRPCPEGTPAGGDSGGPGSGGDGPGDGSGNYPGHYSGPDSIPNPDPQGGSGRYLHTACVGSDDAILCGGGHNSSALLQRYSPDFSQCHQVQLPAVGTGDTVLAHSCSGTAGHTYAVINCTSGEQPDHLVCFDSEMNPVAQLRFSIHSQIRDICWHQGSLYLLFYIGTGKDRQSCITRFDSDLQLDSCQVLSHDDIGLQLTRMIAASDGSLYLYGNTSKYQSCIVRLTAELELVRVVLLDQLPAFATLACSIDGQLRGICLEPNGQWALFTCDADLSNRQWRKLETDFFDIRFRHSLCTDSNRLVLCGEVVHGDRGKRIPFVVCLNDQHELQHSWRLNWSSEVHSTFKRIVTRGDDDIWLAGYYGKPLHPLLLNFHYLENTERDDILTEALFSLASNSQAANSQELSLNQSSTLPVSYEAGSLSFEHQQLQLAEV